MSDEEDNQTGQGATQINPPYIESGQRDKRFKILYKEWVFILVPALILPTASLVIYMMDDSINTFIYSVPVGAAVAVICRRIVDGIDWELFDPVDKVTGGKRRWTTLRRRFPMDREDFVTDAEHGYAWMYDTGVGEMQDGRMVALVQAPSRNTHKQETGEANEMVIQLTGAIRRSFPDTVSVWQTTFDTDPEEYLEKWRAKLHSGTFVGTAWRHARAYIRDLIRREKTEESSWSPRKRRTYISVEVRPGEVRRKSTAESSEESVSDKVKEELTGSNDLTEYQRNQMVRKLRKRVKNVKATARQVAETDVEREEVRMVGPGEHAMLIAKYWRGVEPNFDGFEEADSVALSVWPDVNDYAEDSEQRRNPHRPAEVEGTSDPRATASVSEVEVVGDGGEVQPESQLVKDSVTGPEIPDPEEEPERSRLAEMREGLFNPLSSSSKSSPINDSLIQDRLAPSEYDVEDGYIKAGDQLCKSYWLAGLPKEPASNFLEQLQNMRGVDYDFVVRGVSPQRSDALHWLKEKIEESGASVEELRESHDPDSGVMNEELDYYKEMYGTLYKNRSARAWWMNLYVTIRVGPKRGYELAKDEGVKGFDTADLSPEMAKRQALDNAVDKLVETVEDEPMGLDPVTDKGRADLLFKSAWPTTRDAYNKDCRKEKRSLVLSGSVAATFLFSTATVQEPSGVLYGRDVSNGHKVAANQFLRDGAAHRLTGGRSGSGKTFFVGDQGLQWWLAAGPPEQQLSIDSTDIDLEDGDEETEEPELDTVDELVDEEPEPEPELEDEGDETEEEEEDEEDEDERTIEQKAAALVEEMEDERTIEQKAAALVEEMEAEGGYWDSNSENDSENDSDNDSENGGDNA